MTNVPLPTDTSPMSAPTAPNFDALMAVEVVGFAGDVHGNTGWVQHALNQLHSEGARVVYQLGDFGVWPGPDGAAYLRKVQRELDKLDMLLIVTLGNHECYPIVNRMPVNEHGFLCREHDLPRIWFAPRGHVWTHHGAYVGSLGGAGSIDKGNRTPGKSWWPEEELTQEDVDALTRTVAGLGLARLDVLLTHEIPAGITMPSKMHAAPEIEHYCYMQRVLLRDAVDTVMPRTLLHGHWHTRVNHVLEGVSPTGVEYTADVIGLDMEGAGNLMVAELAPASGIIAPRDIHPR